MADQHNTNAVLEVIDHGVTPTDILGAVLQDDSMGPTVKKGDTVVLDPWGTPEDGDLVLVSQHAGSELTLRRLTWDDNGDFTLTPGNGAYPTVKTHFGETELFGVVTQVKTSAGSSSQKYCCTEEERQQTRKEFLEGTQTLALYARMLGPAQGLNSDELLDLKERTLAARATAREQLETLMRAGGFSVEWILDLCLDLTQSAIQYYDC